MAKVDKRNWTDEDLINAVNSNESIAGVIRSLGLIPVGGNYRVIKKYIAELKLDTSHFTGKGWNKGNKANLNNGAKKSLSEILTTNSNYSSYDLKKRLIQENIKEQKCEKCGRTEWNGEPIPLELHHINGDHSDNRLENLQILCPNCHAQTGNYRGKKKQKVLKKSSSPHKKNKFIGYCPICGKEVYSDRENGQKYCSKECANKANSLRAIAKTPIISKEELLNKLIEFNGVYTEVGKNLEIDRGTVRSLVKKYNLQEEVDKIREEKKRQPKKKKTE